uniref:Long-chain-fatty-acid--CoA ligase n=1 Tax=Steinernema glaseri TaxID=37863 RepID=A0A1I7ZQI3_9BILA
MWLPNGALRIIDRKKHFFKLAQGDFVSPEQVENVYVQHPLVNQIFVDGLRTETYLVAIAVVSLQHIHQLLSQKQMNYTAEEDILGSAAVRNLVIEELRRFGTSKGLNSLEQIKNIALVTEEFTAENGLLTPTLKIRRHQMKRLYEKTIARLYTEGALC